MNFTNNGTNYECEFNAVNGQGLQIVMPKKGYIQILAYAEGLTPKLVAQSVDVSNAVYELCIPDGFKIKVLAQYEPIAAKLV